MTWEDDALEVRVRREEALDALETQAEALAVKVTTQHVVTPLMAVEACQLLQTLATMKALRKAHLRSVAG